MESTKSKIKRIVYNALPKGFISFIKQQVFNDHDYFKLLNVSFSQEGEDQILSQFFYGIEKGFFLDIGAHKPIQYSNTYRFYLNGWRGINIDAMPGSMDEFNRLRPKDINVEAAIGSTKQILDYHVFDAAGVNTFSKEHASEMASKGYKPTKIIPIQTTTLKSILEIYLPHNQKINFLSLDVEGFELDVLQSNNWTMFRPTILLVESLELRNKEVLQELMDEHGYNLIAQTVNNLYFKDSHQ